MEIRTRIYKLFLIVDEPIKIRSRFHRVVHQSTTRSGKSLRSKTDEAYRKALSGHSALALTASCRQVYLESVSLYYAGNAFECVTQGAFSEFLIDIGTTNKNLISNVHIAACNFRYFRKLPDVKTLTIFVRDFDSKYHLPCCVAYALQELSKSCTTLEAVELIYFKDRPNGMIKRKSMRWSRSEVASIDAFLERMSCLYRFLRSAWCTPWTA